jgi:Cu-Zn family superoxide dismutase
MRPTLLRTSAAALAFVALSGCGMLGGGSSSQVGTGTATATLRNAAGATVGSATFTETSIGLLVTGSLTGVGSGTHAIHVHQTGQCTPTFAAAGGHHNPRNKRHGFRSPDGHHAGDLPNLHVPQGGTLTFDLTLPDVRLRGSEGLLEDDGSALVVHAAADDYTTDPAGNSGDRIACGVISG